MKELRRKIEEILSKSDKDKKIVETIKNEISVYPFTTESRILVYLIATKAITYEQFDKLHDEYTKRNKYLELYDLAPRTFGETWGEQHILQLFPEFQKATKTALTSVYPEFDGEFDLWIDGIRVEVKACRANSTEKEESLASRAYLHSEAKSNGFKYHYQQLKPSCCDVFIWIGVCRDELLYWVLSSKELENTGKLGSQHRNENTGIEGTEVFEGQVFMTEEELHPYLVDEKDVLNVVKQKVRK